MTIIICTIIAFIFGSLPLSVWLGHLALGVDIRQVGDGNPGAANVWRAGGPFWGILAILLDSFKGLIPVALANFLVGLNDWAIVPVALAPIAGHTFSPFLHFHGGKALAVTFGVWTGLSIWLVPTILGLSFALWLSILRPEGWAVLAGSLTLLVALLILPTPASWLVIWLGMALIFAWAQRDDLRQRPTFSSPA
jgi:glycerol-3-phosphate acyltransferase PlsY